MTERTGNETKAMPISVSMTFSEKIQKLCDARGWNPAELNRQAGNPVSKASISNYANGTSKPSLDAALAFARALGVSLDYLADDSLDVEPAGADLDENDRTILALSRAMGFELALQRLAMIAQQETLPLEQSRAIHERLNRPKGQ